MMPQVSGGIMVIQRTPPSSEAHDEKAETATTQPAGEKAPTDQEASETKTEVTVLQEVVVDVEVDDVSKTPPKGTDISGEGNAFRSIEGLSLASSEGPPVEEPVKDAGPATEAAHLPAPGIRSTQFEGELSPEAQMKKDERDLNSAILEMTELPKVLVVKMIKQASPMRLEKEKAKHAKIMAAMEEQAKAIAEREAVFASQQKLLMRKLEISRETQKIADEMKKLAEAHKRIKAAAEAHAKNTAGLNEENARIDVELAKLLQAD